VRLGERGHGLEGQRRQPETPCGRRRCQHAEHDPGRVVSVELVIPEARDHECGCALDPAPDEPEDVERGLVRPVDVLEDQDGRAVLELGHQRRDDVVRPRARLDEPAEIPAGSFGDSE